MRTDWVCRDDVGVLLRLLTPANSLAIELSLCTGLRIGDVLSIRTAQVQSAQRITVVEHKTGKRKRIYINRDLHTRLIQQAGSVYVFEHRCDANRHRTRQAVWADVKRAAAALRLKCNCAPHSARKVYAVEIYRKHGLAAAQAALNHDDPRCTLLYIISELIG